jgi:ATP-dependent RNA helicase DDX5/DBP2
MSNLGSTLRSVDWSSQKILHFEKNFYVEGKCVTAHSDREIETFQRAKEMKVWSSSHHIVGICESV